MQEEALAQAGGARIISQDSEDITIPIITSATAPAPAPSQEEEGSTKASGVRPLLLRQGDSDQVLNASGTTTKIKGLLGNVQYYLKPTTVTATNLAIQVRCGWVHARLCWCGALALRVRMGYA
jgi:hypothetical protein